MRFRSPLDDAQLNIAVARRRGMRKNPHEIHRNYAPRTAAENELLQAYRDSIQDFGRELLKPSSKINPRRLNLLSEAAVDAFPLIV